MSLRNECAVCHEKYLGVVNSNYVKLYNMAVFQFRKICGWGVGSLVASDKFVCKECAVRASTIECGCCTSRKSYTSGFWRVDSEHFDVAQLEADIAHKDELKNVLEECGCEHEADRVGRCSYWVCDKCEGKLLRESRNAVLSALKKFDYAGDNADLFLFPPVREPHHCTRCGKACDDDYSSRIKRFYTNGFYLGEEVLHGSRHWDDLNQIAMGFLDSGSLCVECANRLLPHNVNKYFHGMYNGNWRGVFDAGSLGRFKVVYRFEDELCEKVEAVYREGQYESQESCIKRLMKRLQRLAIVKGANALIDFHCEKTGNGGRGCWSGRALPVVVDASVTGIVVVVDGSNVIRAKGGYGVNGLFALYEAFKDKGMKTKVYLDANIIHVLRDAGDEIGAKRLEEAIKKESNVFVLVPAGNRADDYILQYADRTQALVLSNDRFVPYVERYPWIKENRVMHYLFDEQRLMIPDLDFDIEVA